MSSPTIYATKPDYQVINGELWGGATVPGTPIAQAISAAFAETAALAILRNTDTNSIAQGGRVVIPRYVRLICTAVPASSTDAHLQIAVDDINRYSSGGSIITAGTSRSDQLASTANKGEFRVGAIVTSAAGANRKFITRKTFKRAALVVGDEIVIVFGDVAEGTPQALTGTAAQVLTTTTDPIALMPGGNHSLVFHTWYTGNATTPGSFDVEVGWFEAVAP